jgi:3-hydroxybutyrate dehydrogenase
MGLFRTWTSRLLAQVGEVIMMKLQDKVCIVTGAASGIGKAIAVSFAKKGGRIAVADLNGEAARLAADEILSLGHCAMPVEMDVTDEVQVETAVRTVISEFGGVDVLISNAGVQIVHPIENFPLADWKRIMATHLDGAFLTTRACYRQMKETGGGSIIYMGSVHSKEASLLKSAYVTAKHGLLGLCKAVAKEGGAYGIRANVICPGFVLTPLVEKQIPEQAEALGISEAEVVKSVMLRETVDGEFTTVDDVADTALMLAAFGSNALTGQSIVVSHGWFMQ